jgi:hypothetical protein
MVPSFVWVHFCILAAWKCDFCRVMKLTVQGNRASCELIFCIFAAWKCEFWLVVKTSVQRYLPSCDLVFWNLLPDNAISCRVVKSTVPGYLNSCEHVLSIWRLEKGFLPNRETQGSWVPSSVWVNFLHFRRWKCSYSRVKEPTIQEHLTSFQLISLISAPSKCDFWRVVKPTVKGT